MRYKINETPHDITAHVRGYVQVVDQSVCVVELVVE